MSETVYGLTVESQTEIVERTKRKLIRLTEDMREAFKARGQGVEGEIRFVAARGAVRACQRLLRAQQESLWEIERRK